MKLLKVAVAALVMAAMVTPVIAEDRLSLNGEMRVRGWYNDVDVDLPGDDNDTQTWGDQRLRLGGKIAVAEGVSITFRTDITESRWGSGNANGSGRTTVNGSDFQSQHWDRAHIDLTKGSFHLRAGQQYAAYGKTYAVDVQSNGLALDFVGNLPVNVFAFQLTDNGGLAETDGFIYGAAIKPAGESFSSQVFVAGQNKFNDDGEDVYVVGANVALDLAAVKLVAELDFFDGDATDTADAFGTQFLLDASMALSDAMTVGAQFVYAEGDDEDVQYTNIGTGFGGWDPIFDVGTSLSNEEIDLGSPFDFSGENAGVVGGRLYLSTMLGDAKIGASAAYLETEEDAIADADVVALAAGLVYPVMENTSFQLQLQYSDGEANDVDIDAFQAGTGLFVKF